MRDCLVARAPHATASRSSSHSPPTKYTGPPSSVSSKSPDDVGDAGGQAGVHVPQGMIPYIRPAAVEGVYRAGKRTAFGAFGGSLKTLSQA